MRERYKMCLYYNQTQIMGLLKHVNTKNKKLESYVGSYIES